MMIKAFIFGRVLPLGAAGFFMQSAASPIRPALNAFGAAAAALAGGDTQHVEANFPGQPGAPPVQLPTSPEDAKKGISKFFDSIFGDHPKGGEAQAQLDAVINDVKYHGHPPPTPEPQPQQAQQNADQPASAPKGGKGGREIKLTRTGKRE